MASGKPARFPVRSPMPSACFACGLHKPAASVGQRQRPRLVLFRTSRALVVSLRMLRSRLRRLLAALGALRSPRESGEPPRASRLGAAEPCRLARTYGSLGGGLRRRIYFAVQAGKAKKYVHNRLPGNQGKYAERYNTISL